MPAPGPVWIAEATGRKGQFRFRQGDAAAARAAAAGISQFLDLGSGLPAHPAVHEAVREVIPDARVCYVDIDPVAVLHGEAPLARGEGLATVQADLTEPETVLADPQVRAVIDMSQPIAVILAAVLHFLPADSAAALCARYMSRAARGSWLIVSCGHYEDKELAGRLQQTATHTGSGTTTPRIWRRCWPGSSPSGRECARCADGQPGWAANRKESPCTRLLPSASSPG
jgi:O-methyltransferase involved in polyketide biosynthesis